MLLSDTFSDIAERLIDELLRNSVRNETLGSGLPAALEFHVRGKKLIEPRIL